MRVIHRGCSAVGITPSALVLVAHDLDPCPSGDGEEREQLTGRRGEHEQLLRVQPAGVAPELGRGCERQRASAGGAVARCARS